MFFYSKLDYLILIILKFILIKIVLSEQDIYSNINNIFSFLTEEIIETIIKQPNNYINTFIISDDIKDILLKSNQTIFLHHKNIIKINETLFLYFGFKDNNFYIKTYEIEYDETIKLKNEQLHNIPNDFHLDDLKYLEGKMISDKQILLTCIVQNNFEIIILDLNSKELKISVIPEIISIKTMIKKKDSM